MKPFHSTAAAYLYQHYIAGDAEREQAYEEEAANAETARKVHKLRTKAGLTQQGLAARAGTTKPAIRWLEDADYEGHSLSMLKRIAEAAGSECRIR